MRYRKRLRLQSDPISEVTSGAVVLRVVSHDQGSKDLLDPAHYLHVYLRTRFTFPRFGSVIVARWMYEHTICRSVVIACPRLLLMVRLQEMRSDAAAEGILHVLQ
jgi:hypothetical protein